MKVPDNSVTRKVYGRERSDCTDEYGFLSNSMMINATYTVVQDRIWINRVASDLCFSLYPHWPARSSFSLYIQTLTSSTSKMTLMECGPPGNLRVYVSNSSQEVLTVASKIENTVQHAIGWSSIQCHQGRWPRRVVAGVLNEVRQSGHTRRIS